jgi:hypothetical protein|nr:MAG TPA: homing endonuclease [Caudoviricetes sp.]
MSGCIDHGCKGYGIGYATAYYRGRCGKKKYTTKHRVVYCKFHGIHPEDLPDDLVIRHKCDNARCINPLHLEVGTHAENMRDMAERGRAYKGGMQGERNGRCVVSDVQVSEIKALRLQGLTYRAIGERYGIGISQVARIVKGEQRGNKVENVRG